MANDMVKIHVTPTKTVVWFVPNTKLVFMPTSAPVPGYTSLVAYSNGLIKNVETGYLFNSIAPTKGGYLRIDVKIDATGVRRSRAMHRLIAMAFLPNPTNRPYVNHRNGRKDDNRVCNLEWCTQAENVQHAHDTGLNKSCRKPVEQYSMDGKLLKTYASITEAKFETGVIDSGIIKVCQHQRTFAGGFAWRYKGDTTSIVHQNKLYRPVIQYSKIDGSVLGKFCSINEASRQTGEHSMAILRYCKEQKGKTKFIWKYDVKVVKAKPVDPVHEEVKSWASIDVGNVYRISQDGRLYSHQRKRLIKPQHRDGYIYYYYYVDKEKLCQGAHVLVARAYITNPDPATKTMVNHINANPADNRVENLEWVTPKENRQWAVEIGNVKTKKVVQYDLEGNKLATYDSAPKAEKATGVKAYSIREACNNHGRKAGNFVWCYDGNLLTELPTRKMACIYQYTKDHELVKHHKNAKDAAIALNISEHVIYNKSRIGIGTIGDFLISRTPITNVPGAE